MAYRPEPLPKKKKKKAPVYTPIRPFRESGGPPVAGAGGGYPSVGAGAAPPPQTNYNAPGPIDFGQILASDPLYQAALAGSQAQGVSDLADRNARIRTALIRFGAMPSDLPPLGGAPDGSDPNAGDWGAILDPTTRSLAEQNTQAGLSILARLADAAKTAQRRTLNSLGARGAFRSGETGFQLGELTKSQNIAQYDARNNLADYIAGVQAAWVQSERQRLALLAQQQQDARDRAADDPNAPDNPVGPNKPNLIPPNYWDPKAGAPVGVGIIKKKKLI